MTAAIRHTTEHKFSTAQTCPPWPAIGDLVTVLWRTDWTPRPASWPAQVVQVRERHLSDWGADFELRTVAHVNGWGQLIGPDPDDAPERWVTFEAPVDFWAVFGPAPMAITAARRVTYSNGLRWAYRGAAVVSSVHAIRGAGALCGTVHGLPEGHRIDGETVRLETSIWVPSAQPVTCRRCLRVVR